MLHQPTIDARRIRETSRRTDHGKSRKAGGSWWKMLLALAIVALAAGLLYRTLSRYSLQDIVASIAMIPPTRIALATLFAAASYFCLTFFDYLAIRYVGHLLPYRKVAFASFVSLSLGHNIGLAALSSGTIRYRFYSRWGLKVGEIAKVVLFCGVTVGLGITTLGGVALLLRTELAGELTGLQFPLILALGLACLAAPIGYLLAAALVRQPLHIRSWSIKMPSLRLALGQIVIGPINFACVAACLHQSLAGLGDVSYLAVATAYVIAAVTSLIMHVPGGLGVIETVVLFLLPQAHFIGGLLVFRMIYFLVPLCLGAPLFAIYELARRRQRVARN
jgi:uncharacterized membrane protein YbhN (UPF0104 family)